MPFISARNRFEGDWVYLSTIMKLSGDAMLTETYIRKLFHSAAVWNWCAAAPFYFFLQPVLSLLGMKPPVYTIFARLFLALVVVFGYGYWQIPRDPRGNDLVIKMGILGKTWVFLLLFIDGIRGRIHPLLSVVGTVDLIFAALFTHFVLNRENPAQGEFNASVSTRP